jgi:hypothetical protein
MDIMIDKVQNELGKEDSLSCPSFGKSPVVLNIGSMYGLEELKKFTFENSNSCANSETPALCCLFKHGVIITISTMVQMK